jgi:glucose-1-phosphate thymidylyltransferase
MHVIVLAAGYGTRLCPYTEHTPKPLLAVGNKPILERILDLIQSLPDIHQVTIVTNSKYYHHFNEWQTQFVQQTSPSYTLQVLDDGTTSNETRLGPIGDIVFAMKTLETGEDLLILGGDNAFVTNFQAMVSQRVEIDSNILGVHTFPTEKDVAGKFGVVLVDENNKILEFEEKPQHPRSTIAATAIYLIRQQDVHQFQELYSAPHEGEINAGEFIKHLLSKNLPVHCFDIPVWFDIGTLKDWEIADKFYLDKENSLPQL